jgi:hypothetical protein
MVGAIWGMSIKMAVDPEFAKWAEGFSGCDGGNLEGSIWLCGIEWGLGKPHTLKKELQEDVTRPPQRYTKADDVLRGPDGRPYPFNRMFLKLVAAMHGRPVEDYKDIANEEPFPFHRESNYFKLNLFPVAFQKVDAALWDDQYSAVTDLTSRPDYLRWCRENRFPVIRSWVEQGQPELIVCVGLSYIEDFHGAFGISGTKHEETIEGKRLVWFADDTTTVAVVPFPTSPSGLNSDLAVQAFGRRLSGFVGSMKQERGSSPSPARGPQTRTSKMLSANDGWNQTYSEPQSGKQTEFIERALSDVPRTADEIATIANHIAGREVVKPARVTEHLTYHHETMGKLQRERRGLQSRMPQIQHLNGRWSLPSHMRPKGI